jgi:ABC-type sugar transport system ATPase subunit
MHQGTLLQVGSPRETYDHTASPFVAEFLGAANLLNGEVTGTTGLFTDGSLTLTLPKDLSNGRGGKLVLAIKPECILPATAASENSLSGLVQLVEFQGPGVSVQFEYSARTLRATFPLAEGMRIPAAGETLHFRIDWPRCSLFWS